MRNDDSKFISFHFEGNVIYLTLSVDVEGKDINDVFNDLLFAEEHLIQEGFKEGYSKSSAEENIDAYHLGYHRGAELGSEVGFYSGFVDECLRFYKNQLPEPTKTVKNLLALQNLIEVFPCENVEDVDILALLDNIRAQFKKICAILKITAKYLEIDHYSF